MDLAATQYQEHTCNGEHGYQPYRWRALREGEIRLITLLPGQFDDAIRVEISHARLPEPRESFLPNMTRCQLQKTLPPGWIAEETRDGRFLFLDSCKLIKELRYSTTWRHPNYEVHRISYELPKPGDYQCSMDEYEAISYVCGTQEDSIPVFVETAEGILSGTVGIGRNLESALRHLRRHDRRRKLWIDAICINQHDNLEKSIQVRLMSRIYRCAGRVVAWLGPEADGSDLALSTLEFLGNHLVVLADERKTAAPGVQENDWRGGDLRYDTGTSEAIYRFLTREWFDRRWVIQEVGVANDFAILQCGKREMSWPFFSYSVFCLTDGERLSHSSSESYRPYFLSMSNVQSFVYGRQRGMTVQTALSKHMGAKCADTRDTVFALLGIMPPGFVARVMPDYSQSLADSFKDVFLAHVHQSRRWELFGCALQDRKCGGPSWVPDLATPTRHLPPITTQFSSGFSPISFELAGHGTFKVTGLQCATIVARTLMLPADDIVDRFNEAIALLQASKHAIDRKTWAYMYTKDNLLYAYTLALCVDRTANRIPGAGASAMVPRFLFRPSAPTVATSARDSNTDLVTGGKWRVDRDPGLEAELSIFEDWYFKGKTYMTTAEGYIGVGPASVEPGDIICVILGCSRPLVLRPLSDGRYKLVGESFVYGLHDAIPLLGPMPEGWRVVLYSDEKNYQRYIYRFVDDKGNVTPEDPRLEPHPEWERVNLEDLGRDLTGDDPEVCDFLRHRTTGELVDYDPRMLPEALEARGVPLRKFAIV